ncbi:hypothetical protein RB653_003060 [Dictyostelium firmibasis]|uniref:Ubiquitin-like domain-containing protein n=1 Tax=Dictyostelium firmibasis TaxID=79012 RepID=A0AAN7YW49_9MYCE
MSLYFRVKRKEQTIFLSAEPNDTILKLKNDVAHINKLTDGNISEYVRFIFGGNPLDDKKTISQIHIPNDSVIYMVYKNGDSYEEIAPSILSP